MKMKSIIRIWLFLLIVNTTYASDSTRLAIDTTHVSVRQYDSTKVADHKDDADFDYGLSPEAELSIWQRFKIWIAGLLSKLFTLGTQTPIGKILIYLIGGAIIAYAIWKLATIGPNKLTYGDRQKDLNYKLHHEDIHGMDFDQLIDDAIKENNYRLAIRLTYLYALKHLADKQLIDWQPGKTNYDYVMELDQAQLKPGFNALSYYFDYAWYGDFSVDQVLFKKVNSTFNEWRKAINT